LATSLRPLRLAAPLDTKRHSICIGRLQQSVSMPRRHNGASCAPESTCLATRFCTYRFGGVGLGRSHFSARLYGH
jgi:hypothetical protein